MARPSVVKSRTDYDIFRWFPAKNRRRTVATLPLRALPVTERQPLIQWDDCTHHLDRNPVADAAGIPSGNEDTCGTTSSFRSKATKRRGSSKSTAKNKLQDGGSKKEWDCSPDDIEELMPLEGENYDATDCRQYVIGGAKQYRSISSLADGPQRQQQQQCLTAMISGDTTPAGHASWIRRTPSWPSALIKVKDMILEKVGLYYL